MATGNFRLIVSISLIAAVILFCIQNSCGQSRNRSNRRGNRRNGGGGGIPQDILQRYLALQQPTTTTTPASRQLGQIPPLPAPHEVECYVEIWEIVRSPGRCIRGGGNFSKPYMCNSGAYNEFSHYCRLLMEARSRNSTPQPNIGEN